MQAIILAAGRGTRLGADGLGVPKCLLDVGGVPLLEHQLSMLKRFDVREVCVVVGYRAELIIPLLRRMGCTWRINERFSKTNSLRSLSLALDWLRTDFVLCNSDVLADPGIYRSVVEGSGDLLAFDSGSGHETEHMKVGFDANGVLRQIRKRLQPSMTSGENVGLVKLTQSAIEPLNEHARSALAEDGERQWATSAIERLAQERRIGGVDISGLPWVEIDFAEDLDHARSTVWPLIDNHGKQPPRKAGAGLIVMG